MSGMMSTNDYITTNEAASALGVTRQRILQLIQDGRLKAQKFANVYMIRRADLSSIEAKPMGRPSKKISGTDGKVTVQAGKKGGQK